jgi:uncharacterized membrane-anchored protein YhcB (DUF1043 family)
MWKCIRCEKENKDTAEICTECGHGRTMDYVQHRTLSKISAKLEKNWKISRNTEKEIKKLNNENRKKIQDLKKKYRQTQLQAKKDATKETPNENRKNAEEVIQKKLSSLRSSVAFMKDEISKEQDEINTLHGTIEERTKMVDKDAKADKILTTIAWIITISLFLYIVYRYGFDGRWAAVGEFFGGMSDWVKFEGTLSIGDILKVVLVIIVSGGIILFAIAMSGIWLLAAVPAGIIGLIIELLIGRFIGTVSDETLKQAETERDNAQKSIDKKKNEINSIYQKIASSQKQISKIESSMSTLTDNLSRVLPEHMSEELERWTR